MILRNVAGKGNYETAYLPCISIDLSNFPELNKEVGEEIVFVVKGVIRSKRLNGSNGRDCNIDVEVRQIGTGNQKNSQVKDKSLTNKADIFAENIISTPKQPTSGGIQGMTILNDADIQLNKLLSI